LQLRDGDQVVCERRLTTGIRSWGAKGPHLFRQGKRCVVRAVERVTSDVNNWSDWKSAQSTMAVDGSADALASRSSQVGVPLIVRLPESLLEMEALMYSVAHWPSVAIVYVDAGAPMIADPQKRFSNVLFAERFQAGQTVILTEWAQVALCDVHSSNQFSNAVSNCRGEIPVVAIREITGEIAVANARIECDRLQRDLAGVLDCAGYLVMKQR